METLEVSCRDGTPGRLACEVAGEVTCQALTDGSMKTAEEAGTLYLLLHEGTPEPWQVEAARAAGYTLVVQYGETLTLPAPDPPARRRSST